MKKSIPTSLLRGKFCLVSVCLWGWCSVWDFGYDTGKRKKKDFLLNLPKH